MFMKTGRDSASKNAAALSEYDREPFRVIEAIVCNILQKSCLRAKEFLLHNAGDMDRVPVLAIVLAALRAETMRHMDRPDLEAEIAKVRRIIDNGGDDKDAEEGSEDGRDESEGSEDGESGGDEGVENAVCDAEETEEGEAGDLGCGTRCACVADPSEWTNEFLRDVLMPEKADVPVPACRCVDCAVLHDADEAWGEWNPQDEFLRCLKSHIIGAGWRSLRRCVNMGAIEPSPSFVRAAGRESG